MDDVTRESPDPTELLRADLQAVAGRNREAFESVYNATVDRVLALATRLMGCADAADDVASEVFIQVWRNAERYDPSRGSPLAWIMTITRSRALDALRRRASRDTKHLELGRETAAEPDLESVPDLMIATRRESSVHQALADLAPAERQLLALAFFRGYTHSELATITGQPLGTVKTQIRRTLIKMRESMQAQHELTGESR